MVKPLGLLLSVVCTKEFVENFDFGIVHGEMSMVMIVIGSIKGSTNPSGCAKARVSSSSIPSMPNEMKQVSPEPRWEKDNDHGEGR